MKLVPAIASIAIVIAGCTVAGLTGCGKKETKTVQPTIYLLDSGKTGWVKIHYNRPDEAALPSENGFVVAHVNQELKLYTKSRMNPSWDGSQFYYLDSDGKRVRLPSEDNDSRRVWAQDKTSDAEGEQEVFFVGNQEQLSKALKPGFASGQWTPGVDKQPEPDDPIKAGLIKSDAKAEPAKPNPGKPDPANPNSGKVLTELPKK